MEAEQNANASQLPPKEEIRQTSPVEEKSKDLWVILLNIFLALLTILLLAYVAYKNGYINLDNIFNTKDNGEEQAQNEDSTTGEEKIAVVDEEELTLETYEGTVLSAILPSKWSIKEYTNGDGTDMLVDGVTYTGLTGLKVFNGNNELYHGFKPRRY